VPADVFFVRPGNKSSSATNVVVVVDVVLGVVVSTKAFSFHDRSLSNFAYTLVTVFSRNQNRTILDFLN